jgi:hypothetical protein
LTSYWTAKSSVVSPKFQPALNAAMLASRISGFLANLVSRNARCPRSGGVHPRQQAEGEHVLRPLGLLAGEVELLERLDRQRRQRDRVHLVGLERAVLERVGVVAGLLRLRVVNSSVLTMIVAPRGRSARLALSAAGFIATSTSGASPGVRMSWSAKCSWKPTPGQVPAGARISAGKSGSVDRSLPKRRGL